MKVFDNICIIPARGGSKRLPGKNTKDFFGKPVISYAIECAQQTNLFDTIFVSTDCELIARIARDSGAEVPFMRSIETADDHASTLAVLKEVINEFEKREVQYKRLLCMYPVTPLTTPENIMQGLHALEKAPNSLVFPVLEYGHPIWRAISIENGQASRLWDDNTAKRTQDLKPTYHDAGQWYWMQSENILNEDSLGDLPISPVIIDETKAQDVDTYSDWKMLELKYRATKDV